MNGSGNKENQDGAQKERRRAGKQGGAGKIRRLSNPEAAAFAGQLAVLLKAGIPAVEGITLMYEDSEDAGEKKVLKGILDAAAVSDSLSSAMEKQDVFPEYMVRMIRVGEQTGNLDTVMASLEEYYENEEAFRREASDAVFYPLVLACVMIAVVVVLVLQVMPVFEQVYRELGTGMTGFPLALKKAGDGIRAYSVSFLLILGAAALVVFVSRLTEEGRRFWHNFGRHFGRFRKEYETEDAWHFSGVMAMALASGLTPEEGMDLASDLVREPSFKDRLASVREDMEGGVPMAESLKKHGIFSGTYAKMALLGERAGSLDRVLNEIAGMYRQESQERMDRSISTVEPVLVILLSVLIGAVLLSVMLPLLGIISSL